MCSLLLYAPSTSSIYRWDAMGFYGDPQPVTIATVNLTDCQSSLVPCLEFDGSGIAQHLYLLCWNCMGDAAIWGIDSIIPSFSVTAILSQIGQAPFCLHLSAE
jgi:hypothetical protein